MQGEFGLISFIIIAYKDRVCKVNFFVSNSKITIGNAHIACEPTTTFPNKREK